MSGRAREPGFGYPIAFKATDGDVPPCGVFVDNGGAMNGSDYVLHARKTQTLGERPIYVNSPRDTLSNLHGDCVRPFKRPLRVAYLESDGTPAAGEVWGPVAAAYTIRKGFPGFKILTAGSGGIVWAVYDGVGEPRYKAKTDGSMASGSSATCSIYYWSGSAWTDTTVNATVYAPPELSSGSIEASKWVSPKWNGQSRRLELAPAAEC